MTPDMLMTPAETSDPDGGEGHVWAAGGKKLLILDINGLLIDRLHPIQASPGLREPDTVVGKYYVYRRPFCEDFVHFCLDHFVVAVWSSARMHNLEPLVEFTFGNARGRLAFVWDQGHCTDTRLRFGGASRKPVFLKELGRVWEAAAAGRMPWPGGAFGPHNTLLLDDTPYKALGNPPFTAVFPPSWAAADYEDELLVPGGAMRQFLSGLRRAPDVQTFVRENPFGLPPLTVLPLVTDADMLGPRDMPAATLFANIRAILQLESLGDDDAEEAALPAAVATQPLPLLPPPTAAKKKVKRKKSGAGAAAQLGSGAPAGGQRLGGAQVVPPFPDWDAAALREDANDANVAIQQPAAAEAPPGRRLEGSSNGAAAAAEEPAAHSAKRWRVESGKPGGARPGELLQGEAMRLIRDFGVSNGETQEYGLSQQHGRAGVPERGWHVGPAQTVEDVGGNKWEDVEEQAPAPPWPGGDSWGHGFAHRQEPHQPPPPQHGEWMGGTDGLANPGAAPLRQSWGPVGHSEGGSGGKGLRPEWEAGPPFELQSRQWPGRFRVSPSGGPQAEHWMGPALARRGQVAAHILGHLDRPRTDALFEVQEPPSRPMPSFDHGGWLPWHRQSAGGWQVNGGLREGQPVSFPEWSNSQRAPLHDYYGHHAHALWVAQEAARRFSVAGELP